MVLSYFLIFSIGGNSRSLHLNHSLALCLLLLFLLLLAIPSKAPPIVFFSIALLNSFRLFLFKYYFLHYLIDQYLFFWVFKVYGFRVFVHSALRSLYVLSFYVTTVLIHIALAYPFCFSRTAGISIKPFVGFRISFSRYNRREDIFSVFSSLLYVLKLSYSP